jgi:hypothetical protein
MFMQNIQTLLGPLCVGAVCKEFKYSSGSSSNNKRFKAHYLGA